MVICCVVYIAEQEGLQKNVSRWNQPPLSQSPTRNKKPSCR